MIKQTDWHYKLANFGGKRVWTGDKLNFCIYSRYVMYGFLHALIALLLILFSAVWALESVYEFYMWCVYNKPMHDLAIAFMAVFGSAIAGGGGGYIIYKYLEHTEEARAKKRKLKRQAVKEPGFFALLYRKFKDKTCFMVKVEDYK